MATIQYSYAGFHYNITLSGGNYSIEPQPGQHEAANKEKHKQNALACFLADFAKTNMTVLEQAIAAANIFRANFIREYCKEQRDAIALAVALMQQAEIIFTELYNVDMAAQQFYGKADEIASKVAIKTILPRKKL